MSEDIKDKKAVSEIMLFDNLLNSFSSTSIVGIVGMMYFCVNIVLTK